MTLLLTNHGYYLLRNKYIYTAYLLILSTTLLLGQYSISGIISDGKYPIEKVDVYEKTTQKLVNSDKNGHYEIQDLAPGIYHLTVYSFEYNTTHIKFEIIDSDLNQNITLKPLSSSMSTIEILARKKELFGLKKLNAVEGTAIYEGKKSEVVLLDQLVANLASNNPRQIYAQVAGLNIYESNDAGLQLNIGGRGLDPNRTSNFNTRQNGYDISADVLGYPESYYTPPAEALSEIQIIKGAASLQYGTQFGGLINFKFKPPSQSLININAQQTIGSFGLKSSYVDISGRNKKLSYLGYLNYKIGNGYREKSNFDSYNIFLYTNYKVSEKLNFSVEGTYFKYLAQQAGGLTDSQFNSDPKQNTRDRNWFHVDWKLYSSKLQYKEKKTTFSLMFFGLNAERYAVGYRGNTLTKNSNPITDIDEQDSQNNYLNPRDLIKSTFDNWGIEARVLHQYLLGNQKAVSLLGIKYYNARNTSFQGAGTSGIDADFSSHTDNYPDYPNQSFFEFPNKNIAVFTEQIFNISKKLSFTPGLRIEHIKTESDGNYKNINFDAAGNPIFSEQLFDISSFERSFILAGLGISYKSSRAIETYANISQNYRSVTFSDIRTVNPSFIIDPDITDESGATMDFGLRGQIGKQVSYDVGIYSLLYNNRIGITIDEKANRVRKNIGQAIIYGIESFTEWNITKSINEKITDRTISWFVNIALTDSRYLSSQSIGTEGNTVEFVPQINMKTGLKIGYKNFLGSVQFTHLSSQYSDAQNSTATQPGDAREGIIGVIPSYQVVDMALNYRHSHFTLSTGINNVLDSSYFTRRATGYPGPGIIPSDGRSLYISIGFEL